MFVLRPNNPQENHWTCIDLTKAAALSNNRSDTGGKFCAEKNSIPEFDRIKAFTFQLQPNDIVLLSSDGLGDCIDPNILKDGSTSLESNMSEILRECSNPLEMQEKLQNYLQKSTIENKIVHFTNDSEDLKLLPVSANRTFKVKGCGKPDHANMAFFTYQ